MKFIDILDEKDKELFTNISNAFGYSRIDSRVTNDLALAKRVMLRKEAKVHEQYDNTQRKFIPISYTALFKSRLNDETIEVLGVKDLKTGAFELQISKIKFIDGPVPRDLSDSTNLSFYNNGIDRVFVTENHTLGDCSHNDSYIIDIDKDRNILSITKSYLEDNFDYSNTRIINEKVL